jgi:flavin reductase (DIM6/NTAB) family NADH-FMN oxidoreductase RutF
MKTINSDDIASFKKLFRTNFINSLTGFKSVALIGSKNAEGTENLAIFSQIFHVGANPPLIGILFRPHIVSRHTLENILDNKEFTISHIRQEFLKEAHNTSARWESSEFTTCGLQPEYSETINAPYVKKASVQIGCSFTEKQTIQANKTELIIAQIMEVRIQGDVIGDDGFIDLEKAGTLTCSGLDSYHSTQKIARYAYAKPDKKLEEI